VIDLLGVFSCLKKLPTFLPTRQNKQGAAGLHFGRYGQQREPVEGLVVNVCSTVVQRSFNKR
jgi:hypothetical protein